MLRLFLGIRKSLLKKGAFKKYLLYALGEVFLVMIGILLALQVNNWNNVRQERIIEKELLNGLYESVKNNQSILEQGLRSWNSTIRGIEIIYGAMEKDIPYHDSMQIHFKEAHRSRGNNLNGLDFSGYKALENQGYDILRNKTVRKSMISLFESTLPGLGATNEQVDFSNSGFHTEYIVRNFISSKNSEYPLDYTRVMNDKYYLSILTRLEYNLIRKINRVRRSLKKIESDIELLEEELNLN